MLLVLLATLLVSARASASVHPLVAREADALVRLALVNPNVFTESDSRWPHLVCNAGFGVRVRDAEGKCVSDAVVHSHRCWRSVERVPTWQDKTSRA